MFAATPRWRDRIDARKALLVAVVALALFALQLALLASTVASPLGGMIASLETIPQVDRGPVYVYGRWPAAFDPGRPPEWTDGLAKGLLDERDQVCLLVR